MIESPPELEFQCPRCRGKEFGFSGEQPDGSLNRYCGGPGCKFTWNSKEDWRHFKYVARAHFESAEDFENNGGWAATDKKEQ